MTEFGLATVFGSVCFCTTIVPAFAHLINYGVTKPRPSLTQEEIEQNEHLMKSFLREMIFIIIGLSLFYSFLEKESLSLGQCIILLMVFLLYVAAVAYQQMSEQSHQK